MKKRMISAMAVATLMLTTTMTTFAASASPVMFGDNVQRTHENGFTDKSLWAKEVFLGSGASGGISLASSSTAIGAGNIMYYPVSAGNEGNNFTGTGYMTIWDMSKWVWDSSTSQDEPTFLNKIPIPNVSNSSPVYDPSTGYAYLAAGGTFYKFNSSGEVGSVGISVSNPIYANQVVSYPLYATASELGTSTDEIWISSQNGYLFAVDPSTMKIIQKVYLGQRLDASPSLVRATDGTTYIAVTAANSPNNKPITLGGTTYPGTGFLFLVNPRDGAVTTTVPNPSGSAISSTASPVSINSTIPGGIMWNDIDGNVFLGTMNPNGTVTFDHQWDNIGNGQTSDFSESGFSSAYDQYIVPFTDQGQYGYATVNPKTFDVKQISDAGSSGQIESFGSPEISASGNLYLADRVGGIDQIVASSSGGFNSPSSNSDYLASQGGSSGTTLSTPSELMLDTKIGTEAPTLSLATSQGLELWANGIEKGEDLMFAQSYPSSSPTQFSQPLTLTPSNSNLVADPGNADKIDFDFLLNGNTKMDDIGSVATYDASGNPITGAITIPTSTLDSWLSSYEAQYPSAWNNSGGQNLAVIEAFPGKGDTFTYQFVGTTAAPDGSSATVTVTFPAPGTSGTTSTFNPHLCVESNGTSCSSEEPGPNDGTFRGYLEYRNLWPGQNSIAEGVDYSAHNNVKYADPTLGTPIAYKLHPIPEQVINSAKAAPYTSYYTWQKNTGGNSFSQTPNWFNQYTVEFVNGTTSAQNIQIGAEMDTVGDMLYGEKYITSWQPEVINTVCGLWGCSYEVSYTPNYGIEYLYRNSNITEKIAPVSLHIPYAATYWWDPTTASAMQNVVNVTATPQQSFSGSDTPITPSGSSLSWSQPVWASYGPWEPSSAADTKVYEQVPETAGLPASNTPPSTTPENMLPGTPSDTGIFAAGVQAPDRLTNTWYSDAPAPSPFTFWTSSPPSQPAGTPVSHAFDSAHNGGTLFEPLTGNAGTPSKYWWVMPVFTVSTGNMSVFEHPQISQWIPSGVNNFATDPWKNNSGTPVTTGESTKITWNTN